MLTLRRAAALAFLLSGALHAAPLAAQAAPITITDPIDLKGKLDVRGEDELRGPRKILIPMVLVRYALKGSLTVVNSGRFYQTDGKTVKAKGKYMVAGLEKAYVQGLAQQLQDDLVARLRGAGYTVLTYDDVKDDPEVVKMGRYKPDAGYDMPTDSPRGTSNTYLMGFPSDAQAIDPPFQGYGWGFRKVAKDHDAIVMVPEYRVDAPLLGGSKRHGIASRGASVSISADMVLNASTLWITPKGKWGSAITKGQIEDLATDDVGSIGDATDDSPRAANAIAAGLAALSPLGADLQTKSGMWGMKVDQPRYTAALLRGAVSVNMAIEQVVKTENAKAAGK
ncbi:MAG TPA: hypothetical protein VGE27_14000 [Gemmatimonas sp.]|uniref:hypothetical protein n=1 Tax=Gemmatimonas sp. TaxID=1962908 RepID=UPI002ED851DA